MFIMYSKSRTRIGLARRYNVPFAFDLVFSSFSFFRQPDDVYETSSVHHQTHHQLRVWEGHKIHGDPKNAESYEIEKREVVCTVNNFMTKLYIESQRFKNNGLQ